AADEINALLVRQRQRLVIALRAGAAASRARLEALAGSRVLRRPLERVQMLARGVDELSGRLSRVTAQRMQASRRLLESRAAQLESLSPLAVLGRGYSVTTRESGGLVRRADELTPGDVIVTRLGQGQATSRVEAVETATLPANEDSFAS